MSEEPAQVNSPEPPRRAAPACHYGHFAGGVVKAPIQRDTSLLNGQMENPGSASAASAGLFHRRIHPIRPEKSLLNGQTGIGSSRRTRES